MPQRRCWSLRQFTRETIINVHGLLNEPNHSPDKIGFFGLNYRKPGQKQRRHWGVAFGKAAEIYN